MEYGDEVFDDFIDSAVRNRAYLCNKHLLVTQEHQKITAR